jgi:hypothetical protein
MPGRVFLGVILILLGAGLLLDLLGVFAPYGTSFAALLRLWWPVIIVLIGLNWLVKAPRHPWWPLLVMAIGALMLLSRLMPGYAERFWPIAGAVALVLLGVRALLPRERATAATVHVASATRKDSADETVRYHVSFNGLEARNTSSAFRGGEIEASFSGLKLDLRGAALAPEGATLEVRAAFSGVEILLPPDWVLAIHDQATLGAVEDTTANPKTGTPVLTIHAAATMGAIELKN